MTLYHMIQKLEAKSNVKVVTEYGDDTLLVALKNNTYWMYILPGYAKKTWRELSQEDYQDYFDSEITNRANDEWQRDEWEREKEEYRLENL